MINLRYHIVSIMAVFLALGIGVAMGTSFIDGFIVDRLEGSVADLEAERERDSERIAELEGELSGRQEAAAELEAALLPSVFSRRLDGVPVMVLATDDVESEVLTRLRSALLGSGARYEGIVRFSDAVDLEDATGRRAVAEAIAAPDDSLAAVRSVLVERLAAALFPEADRSTATELGARIAAVSVAGAEDEQAGPPRPRPDRLGPDDDVLEVLLNAGFVDFDSAGVIGADLRRLPRVGTRYIVVDTDADAQVSRSVLVPLLEAVADGPPQLVVAGVSRAGPSALLASVRTPGLSTRFASVDHLASFAGVAAAVLALDRADELAPGRYGRQVLAQRLLPVR